MENNKRNIKRRIKRKRERRLFGKVIIREIGEEKRREEKAKRREFEGSSRGKG